MDTYSKEDREADGEHCEDEIVENTHGRENTQREGKKTTKQTLLLKSKGEASIQMGFLAATLSSITRP